MVVIDANRFDYLIDLVQDSLLKTVVNHHYVLISKLLKGALTEWVGMGDSQDFGIGKDPRDGPGCSHSVEAVFVIDDQVDRGWSQID